MPAFTLEDQWRQYPESFKKPAGVKLKPAIRRVVCDSCHETELCLELRRKDGGGSFDICIDCARDAFYTLQENT